jgi:hypothetical protein
VCKSLLPRRHWLLLHGSGGVDTCAEDQLLRINTAVCNVNRVRVWAAFCHDNKEAATALDIELKKRIQQEDMMKRRQMSSEQIHQVCHAYAEEEKFFHSVRATRTQFPQRILGKSIRVNDEEKDSLALTGKCLQRMRNRCM